MTTPAPEEESDIPPLEAQYKKASSTVKKALKDFRGFRRTRREILNGQPLWNEPIEKIREAGYLGPWKFRTYQMLAMATLGTASASIGIYAVRLFYKANHWRWEAFDDDSVNVFREANTSYLIAAFFFLTVIPSLTASIVARSSLRSRDSNVESRQRALKAYLYIGTATQLWTAAALVVFGNAYSSLGYFFVFLGDGGKAETISTNPFFVGFAFAAYGLMILLVCRQLYLSGVKVPNLLFKANNYSIRLRLPFQKRRPDDPPRLKMWTFYLLITFPITLMFGLLAALLAKLWIVALAFLDSLL